MTIKEIRKNCRLTQEEAAKLVGIPLRTYTSYENDEENANDIKLKHIKESLNDYYERYSYANSLNEFSQHRDAKYSKAEILKIVKEQNVQYLRLQFTDMLGTIKAVEIPVSKLEDALNNKIMFDGSSIEGFVRIKEADMYLHPDIDTFLILTFEDSSFGRVARFICDVYTPDGQPFKGDPRYLLKQQIKAAHKLGFHKINVGFEPEFYLFKLDENKKPTLNSSDEASYFDNAPMDGAEYVRRDISLELEKLGFDIQTSHHEVGPGQNEINFKYDEVLRSCDRVQTFKQVVKVIARKHGYLATFMPKPMTGQAGSGMHTNISIVNKEGNNLFHDKEADMELSLLCKKWISGVLNHSRELSVLTNPTVNSYKRLVSGYEAPIYVCWSDANRSSLIRIPAIRGKATRTEIRNVDPTANPYLALAGIIAAGLDGIQNIKEKDLVAPQSDNIFLLTPEELNERNIARLPQTLHSAVEEFRNSKLLKKALGEHTFNKIIEAKEKEWFDFHTTVTKWELEHLLDD
ncbi:MAG: type I glutamate--ammonia ligase [Bacilli bacterium]|nr:type I glutamate--ammonia ligase [Bacilli bacterium]